MNQSELHRNILGGSESPQLLETHAWLSINVWAPMRASTSRAWMSQLEPGAAAGGGVMAPRL